MALDRTHQSTSVHPSASPSPIAPAPPTSKDEASSAVLTLGEFAYQTIAKQYRSLTKQDKKVLADKDPEHLHAMRVASRRLRTALNVFDTAIVLPPVASPKRIATLARTLGQLRDLDVQMAELHTRYRPQLPKTEQKLLDEAIVHLRQQRQKAFATVEKTLTRSRYRKLKTAYTTWLQQPEYTPLSALPLLSVVPDLLNPLLSHLLLHPGWLVPMTDSSPTANETLHDLRKACKHARYQAEFFAPFYGVEFKQWIDEIKTIQEKLGTLHDGQILLELLTRYLPAPSQWPTLAQAIYQTQTTAVSDWETTRHTYLDPTFRQRLRSLLLNSNTAIASESSLLEAQLDRSQAFARDRVPES